MCKLCKLTILSDHKTEYRPAMVCLTLDHLRYHHKLAINTFNIREIDTLKEFDIEKQQILIFVCDSPQILFLSKMFPENYTEDRYTTVALLSNSQYECIFCDGEFDVLPTAEILLSHLKLCVDSLISLTELTHN